MRNLKLIIALLLFLSFLFNSCKIKILEDSNPPYSIFEKGSKKGVINTISKEIIIPAKFGWIERYDSKYEYPLTNEIFYFATYPNENNSLYFKSSLFNSKGKLIYTFGVGENIKSFFRYKKQFYFITKTLIYTEPSDHNHLGINEYDGHLLLINENQAQIILTKSYIERVGNKNFIKFYVKNENENHFNQLGYFDLNSHNQIIKESVDFYNPNYIENKNEIWVRNYNKEKRELNKYFETVLDSSLTLKTNPIKNVIETYQNYVFTENEKGNIQITDFNGSNSTFSYPFLTRVKYHIIVDIDNQEENKDFDKLFVFSIKKVGDLKGVINSNGNIILPPKYKSILIRKIKFYDKPETEFVTYIKENKLFNYYYFTIQNEDNAEKYSVFNEDGTEIISFKSNGCNPEFNFKEKAYLQINFHCYDSIFKYDLITKKLIHSEKMIR